MNHVVCSVDERNIAHVSIEEKRFVNLGVPHCLAEDSRPRRGDRRGHRLVSHYIHISLFCFIFICGAVCLLTKGWWPWPILWLWMCV